MSSQHTLQAALQSHSQRLDSLKAQLILVEQELSRGVVGTLTQLNDEKAYIKSQLYKFYLAKKAVTKALNNYGHQN
jgi:hypothetical protein